MSAVTAAALVAGAGLAVVAPASAVGDTTEPRIVSARLNRGELRIPMVGFGTLRITSRVTDAVGVTYVHASLLHKGVFVEDDRGAPFVVSLVRTSGTGKDGVWTKAFGMDRYEPVGAYEVLLFAGDKADNMTLIENIGKYVARFKSRFAHVTFSPAVVRQGRPVTIAGRLDRVAPGGWKASGDRAVDVQFRAAGTTAWVRKGGLRTDADGTFGSSRKFTVAKTGVWRVVFAGSPATTKATSASTSVKAS